MKQGLCMIVFTHIILMGGEEEKTFNPLQQIENQSHVMELPTHASELPSQETYMSNAYDTMDECANLCLVGTVLCCGFLFFNGKKHAS